MHERLALLDPASALAIHPNNKKRVIRAIEYALLNRERISEHNASLRQKTSPYRFKYVVLTMDRKRLYERINQRVEDMLRTGLVEEVKALCALGCREGMTSMQGIGYRQVLGFLQGQYDKAEMEEKIKRATRHFAKRQLTWFKRERDAVWFDVESMSVYMSLLISSALMIWRFVGMVTSILWSSFCTLRVTRTSVSS